MNDERDGGVLTLWRLVIQRAPCAALSRRRVTPAALAEGAPWRHRWRRVGIFHLNRVAIIICDQAIREAATGGTREADPWSWVKGDQR
jgi:hypothetical protein